MLSKFSYISGEIPKEYICSICNANGIKLYRKYQTFLDQQKLYCKACAFKDQTHNLTGDCCVGKYVIGWLVAAVPTEDGSTYWGFTSVPDDGVKWWDGLS